MPNCQEQPGESSELILFLPMREFIKEYHVHECYVNKINTKLFININTYFFFHMSSIVVFKISASKHFFYTSSKFHSQETTTCMSAWLWSPY